MKYELEFAFGHGRVACGGLNLDGRIGVFMRNLPTPGEIGQDVPGLEKGKKYEYQPGDVVIWMDAIHGSKILQECVNEAIEQLVRKG